MKLTGNLADTMMGNIPPETFADGTCHMIPAFGNMCVFETKEGLIIFDLPLKPLAPPSFKKLREITEKPVKYLIYSHGHIDHAYGFDPIIKEVKEKGWEMPEIIAHENCIKRFKKYNMLDQYHEWLNQQQFSALTKGRGKLFPSHEELEPTIVLRGNDVYKFKFGGYNLELYPEYGETDDAIWLWIQDKKVIFAGDLMVSHFPNVGNPFKVQRYPKGWALAMEKMLEKHAEWLAPGHGVLIEGENKVQEVLSVTAEALNFVHDEVVKRMNEGKWFEQIFHELVEIYPDRLKNHEYLAPIYGCFEFAIHAVYRLYHGWYDTGNPTDLFPAKSEDIATELLEIADEQKYIEQAKKNIEEGNLQMALHLLDVIIKGTEQGNDELLLETYKLKSRVLKKRAKEQTSFIAANIINNGTTFLRPKIKELEKRLKEKKQN
ncbi:MAG: MBL fold metallo-hydrolase [Candidatus Lokiarchaeota archaeon]|nr:MBL fold metallo-hydrolase [Candidatus Lokiarchaeota archaeon]